MRADLLLKNKEKIQKLKETGDSKYIYHNDLGKACFQHGMAYEDFMDLPRGTITDTILKDKAINIAKHLKYNGYQCGLPSMFYRFLDKKTSRTNKRTVLILV